MADGSIKIPVEIDDKAAQKELQQLEKSINKLQTDIEKNTAKKAGITAQLETAKREAQATQREIEQITRLMQQNRAEMKARGSAVSAGDQAAYNEAQKTASFELRQQQALLQKQESAIASLTEKEQNLTREIQDQTSQLQQQRGRQDEINKQLADQAAKAWPKVKEQAKDAMGQMNSGLKNGLKTLVRYGLGMRSLFVLFRKLRQYVIDGVKAFAEYDEETKNSINSLKMSLSNLKGALGSAFAPIFNAVAPALQWLIDLVTKAANAVGQFFAVLGGKTTFKKAVTNLEAVESTTSGAAAAAEEAQKNFSGLDELNVWQDNESSGGGGGAGSSGLEYEDVAIDPNSKTAKIADFVRTNLESVELLVEIFGFVIGLILVVTGASIPLGLGMMIFFGYEGVKNVTENWGAIAEQLRGPMGTIMAIASGALLAIGLILVLTGVSIPLGIGMIVAGAAGLAATVAANWDTIKDKVMGALQSIKDAYNKWAEEHPVIAGIINAIFGFVKQVFETAISILTNIFKGEWIADAWEAIKTAGETVVKTIEAVVKKAATWVADAWTAIKTTATTVVKTIEAAVKKAATWVADAWTAIKTTATTVTKTIEAAVKKAATWVSDAWTALKTKAETVKKTFEVALKKNNGNWAAAAYDVLKGAVKTAYSVATSLVKQGWTKVVDWVDSWSGGAASKAVALAKTGWTSVKSWITDTASRFGGNVSKAIDLIKNGWKTVADWVRDKIGGVVSVGISLIKSGWNSFKSWLGLSDGGVVGANGGVKAFAAGGKITRNAMKNWGIPMYAGGTSRAHGTMFVAGENGSEIVGNINGRTEVLNRSQLAQVMYAAIVRGMSHIFSSLASAVSGAKMSIDTTRTSVEHIAYLLSGPGATVMPVVASGTMIPPSFYQSGDKLAAIQEALEALAARLDGVAGGQGASYEFIAQLNRRTLFDEMIDEGRLRRAQSGSNPFDL